VALLANLLGIPIDDRFRAPNYSPPRKARRTLEVLVEHVEGSSAGQPVLVIYEDVHWVDPSSLELLTLLIDRIDRLPVVVLLTFRPEFTPSWHDHTHVTRLTLTRLTRPHVMTMVGRVAGKPLPEEVLQQIIMRADGMPLFVEELTKTFVESGLLEDLGARYRLAKPLPPLAVPATLHASLIARLDRLQPPVKEVAQTAACIGRDFSFDLLAAVLPLAKGELGIALDRLVQAELVFRRSEAPEMSYRFKHALVREAAWGSLLKARRRSLHRVIATALERQFPGIATAEPEVVAHHFTEGGLPARAVEYWLKAGRSAMGRSAVVEVVNHTRSALDLVGSLSDDAARVQMEIELQALRGTALQALQGWGAEETGEAFSRARELCEAVQASERILPVLYGIYVFHLSRAEYASALMLAEQFLRTARTLRRAPLVGIGHRLLASPTCLMGDAASARDELKSGLALYATDRPPSLVAELGMDQKSGSLGWLSIALLALGFPDQALEASETGLAHADALNHLPSLVFALSFAGMVRIERGENQEARRHAEHLERLSSEQGLTLHLSTARIIRGATLVASADAMPGWMTCAPERKGGGQSAK
jgi:predicted ATPase